MSMAQVSWRRLLHPLWRPLRGLALSDYEIRGAVTGSLFGKPYSEPTLLKLAYAYEQATHHRMPPKTAP